MTKREANENAVAGSADEKEAIVDSSTTATENQSNASLNPGAADGATPVTPSHGIQHPAGAASEDDDHPPNGRNDRGSADTGQRRIEPPNNREKIPENRECKEPVGYGRPPVAFRFRPGKSGNPGGRPRRLPVTERYAETLEMQLPPVQRRQVEQDIRMKLPKKYTFGELKRLTEELRLSIVSGELSTIGGKLVWSSQRKWCPASGEHLRIRQMKNGFLQLVFGNS